MAEVGVIMVPLEMSSSPTETEMSIDVNMVYYNIYNVY